MKKIIVIGGGASGLMAAVTAARQGAAVTVLEQMEKPGKKLLITGNGRCNLTNLSQGRKDRYRGGSQMFINSVMDQFSVEKTMAFFEELGLLLRSRDGYVYPYVNQASAVLDVLLLEGKRLGVRVKCTEKVTGLLWNQGVWKVLTNSWRYEADAVILCAGSKAAPATGSDGSGYRLAKSLGHTVIPPMEALVPLKTDEKWVRKLSGLRMPAGVTLLLEKDGSLDAGLMEGGSRESYTETGEIQWTDYGISGIVIFQVSRYAVRGLSEGKKVTAVLDLMPELERERLCSMLHERRKEGKTAEEFLTGMLPKKAIPVILQLAGIAAGAKASSLTQVQMERLTEKMKALPVPITGHKSFDMAQVCSGGVDTCEICPDTLESRIFPQLYFCGEILDVDGICGGYNLQWAWSSGYTAGVHSAGPKESAGSGKKTCRQKGKEHDSDSAVKTSS